MAPASAARRRTPASTFHRRAAGATQASTEIFGIPIAYDDEGAGLPIVCLHAVGHGAADFAPLRKRLRSRFRVVALDFPDHGGSGPDHEPVSASRYAQIVQAFLEARHIDGPILVGNSIGGAAAIELAARARGRVRG